MYGKGDEVGNDDGDRHYQAREVDFAKEVGVGCEGGAGAGEAGGEVTPKDVAGHVEEHLGQAVGGELGDVAEDDGEHQRGEQRLNQEPQRAKDGLLVARDEIAADEEADQVAIMPDVAQLEIPPHFAGGDDEVPVLGGGRRGGEISHGRGLGEAHTLRWGATHDG